MRKLNPPQPTAEALINPAAHSPSAKQDERITTCDPQEPPAALALIDQTGDDQLIHPAASPYRRLDEIKEEHLRIFAENSQIVCLMDRGVTASEAVRILGVKRTDRAARDLYKRFKRSGRQALMDTRWLKGCEAQVMTTEVQSLSIGWFMARPAAGPRVIWKQVCDECRERGLQEPSESSVKHYLSNLSDATKKLRHGKSGIKEWDKQNAPVVRYENTTYANQRWQGDHTHLDIRVKVQVNGVWQPVRAYLTVLLDAHTRAVVGHVVSTRYPNSWTIALTFYRAIMQKRDRRCRIRGICSVFQSDRGRDFISDAIKATLAGLRVDFDPDPPYYPNRKGKVERFFRTLDTGCLRILPGHTAAMSETHATSRVHELLTIQQLDRLITRWIDDDYHERVHSETNRKPAEFWFESVRLRVPNSEDDLVLLLCKFDKECSVGNIGIKVTIDGVPHRYWSPELVDRVRERVKLRYNPDDMASVIVYCAATGERICEASDLNNEDSKFKAHDVLECRRQVRRALVERTKKYLQDVYENDRNNQKRLEVIEARRIADEIEQSEAAQQGSRLRNEDTSRLTSYLDLFKRQDGGR